MIPKMMEIKLPLSRESVEGGVKGLEVGIAVINISSWFTETVGIGVYLCSAVEDT